MALPPKELQETAKVISNINSAAESLYKDEPGAREKILNLAYTLAASVELPSEAISRIGWAEPARFALCRLAIDLEIFEKLNSNGQNLSASELAKSTNSHPILMERMLKHLAAMNIITETAEDQYASNSLSQALIEPKYRDGLIYTYDIAGPSFRSMPTYLKSISYGHPESIADGPFQYAHHIQTTFFQYLAQNPKYLECFNNYMGGYRAGKQSWTEFYPFEDRTIRTYEKGSSALLVDVGGGMGHDLQELCATFPNLPGRLILQDKDDVIAQLGTAPMNFEAMAHDFFAPQPIVGARAYYLHSVLHDWSDEDCRRILKPLVSVMRKGYSKILINELIIPNKGANWFSTSMDWLMMALGAVKERTEFDWNTLLKSVGLKITDIWTYEQGTESLIEAELA